MFTIISVNVNSITGHNRRNYLFNILKTTGADLCLAQETKLDHTIQFNFPGFLTFRNDIRRGVGGTAIIFKNSIPHRGHVTYGDNFQSNSIQLKVNGAWHRFTSLYIPPGLNLQLNDFMQFFGQLGPSFIGGDTNARLVCYGDMTDNNYGKFLQHAINSLGGLILNPPQPTCHHSSNGSFIDKFINLNSLPVRNMTVFPSFADHDGIKITIPYSGNFQSSFDSIYDYSNTNFEELNLFIDNKISNINIPTTRNLTVDEIDKLIEDYNDIFSSAIKRFVPIIKIKSGNRIKPSAALQSLMSECKRIQNKLLRNANAQFNVKRLLINQIRLLKIMIRNLGSYETSQFFTNRFDEVKSTLEAFKTIKHFTGHKKRLPMGSSIFVDSSKQKSIHGSVDIANELGKQFSSINGLSSKLESSMTNTVRRDILALDAINCSINFNINTVANIDGATELFNINNTLPAHQKDILTCTDEVRGVIASRPNKKSSGYDQIPFTMVKSLSPIGILFLTILFNHCLAITYFPTKWRCALVSGIPKPGKDNSILCNWRPISQLSCISKIFEKIISTRLCNIIHKLNIFDDQFGFLKNHSTVNALARLQNGINIGLNRGMLTSIVAVDLRSAFDVVWVDGLVHKMIKLGIPPLLCKLIQNFLKQRSFRIRLGGHLTDEFQMENGMPQGSVLSPTLFNLYVHDIPKSKNLTITQFADDTTVHITHKDPIFAQNCINLYLRDLSNYLKDWKLLLSEGKTEFLNVIGRITDTGRYLRKKAVSMKIALNGQIIPHSTDIRLLGVQFQRNNTFVKNIQIRLAKARRAKFAISRLLRNRHIESNIKTNLYKIYLRSILTYGSPVWCIPPNVSSHQMELMRVFERACLRSTANIKRDVGTYKHINAKHIHDISNCGRIDKFISQAHINFYDKCIKSRNRKFKLNGHIGRGKYKPTFYLHYLHLRNRLLDGENRLIIFNKRYDGSAGLVYNINQ